MSKKIKVFSRIFLILALFLLSVSLVGCTSLEDKAAKASALVEEEKYDEAIKLYNEILDKDASNSSIYLELAKIYRILDDGKLEEQILKDGIKVVEDKLPLQFALADFYINSNKYEKGEKILREILEEDEANLQAYETLLDIFTNNEQYEKIIEFYNDKKDIIQSDKGTMYAINSTMQMGDWEQARTWLNSIDINNVEESWMLESLTKTFLRLGDINNAMIAANKGVDSDNPSLFHGYVFGLNNKELNLIAIEKGDINGDGIEENVILMSDGWGGNYSEIIKLFIQNSANGELIEVISLSDIFTGVVSGVSLVDLNNDGILDILGSIHSGGSGGMQVHYSYSFKDNNKVDLLKGFHYGIDFMFLDDFKVEVFCDELKKSFEIEFCEERRQDYIDLGYYTASGLMLDTDYGYFKYDVLDGIYIESLNQYGLSHYTNIIGPSFGSDTVAIVETTYVMKDGQWTVYDFKVESSDDSKVTSIPYDPKRHENSIAKDVEKIDKYFAMTIGDVFGQYGVPKDTGYLDGGEYFAYDKVIFFISPGNENKISALSFPEGTKIFGLEMYPTKQEIINVFGDNGSDDEEYGEEFDSLFYNVGGYEIYFSPIDESLYYLTIKGKYW